MQARDLAQRRTLIRAFVMPLAVAALLSAVAVPGAAAKKKSGSTAKTATTTVTPGGEAATTAACSKNNHVTGGGYSVSPSFSPGGLTGSRIESTLSRPLALKSWTSGASAYATPPQPGSLTVYARCEPNSSIKALATAPPNSSTIPVGLSQTTSLSCPSGAKILSGGYAVSPPPSLSDPNKRGASILQSRRSAPNTWTVQVGNPSPPNGFGPVTFSASFICDKGGKTVKERSITVPIAADARTSADVSCSKKQHVVSGGYAIAPNTSGAPVPAVEIDEFRPNGKKAWHLGLYELTGFELPAGSIVTLTAYCRQGS
jgi:hypothetical protein